MITKKVKVSLHIIFMNGIGVNKSITYNKEDGKKDVDYISKAIEKYNPKQLPTTFISVSIENYTENKNHA